MMCTPCTHAPDVVFILLAPGVGSPRVQQQLSLDPDR